ncbi:MAG: SNF2-related protein [Anaerolineae bacterium]
MPADMTLPRYILHGTWTDDGFFLWAEVAEPAPPRRGWRPRIPRHPHAASEAILRKILSAWLPQVKGPPATEATLRLPTHDDAPLLPPWLDPAATAPETAPTLDPWKVTGLTLDVLTALAPLVGAPPRDKRWGGDLRYWSIVAKLGLEVLTQQRYFPTLTEDEGTYRARWQPILDRPRDRARLRTLAEAMPAVCRALVPRDQEPAEAEAPQPTALLDTFLAQLTDRAVRDWGRERLDGRRKPPAGVAGAWWEALWAADNEIIVPVKQRRALGELREIWQGWFGQLRGAAEAPFRLCFRLEPPEIDEETGIARSSEWTLRYLLQANDDPSLLVPLNRVWYAKGGTLEYLNYRFDGAQEYVLGALGSAARLFPPILESLRTARPETCALSAEEAYDFLREVGPLLESSGFGVLVPPWWEKPGARLSVRAKARLKSEPNVIGKGILSLRTLVQFDWELALGGEPLSREEFERLVALKQPLVQVRGQWVLLQPEEIEAAIAFWKQRQEREMELRQALNVALGATEQVGGLPLSGVEVSGALAEMVEQLQDGEQMTEIPTPDAFVGTLRPYQKRGASWLAFMRRWGLGACLADDMGLGKTIQAIALLLHEREQKGDDVGPALIICPASVLTNWKREIHRFAPDLRVLIQHGTDRATGETFVDKVAPRYDVILTTYGTARRDVTFLQRMRWSDVILDEAQNIKNPSAKQTRAVRQLEADNRVALTGTPVENRLSELWSIMQFLNPGLLGSKTRFRETFALPIERYQDAEATARLRQLVDPFILRRLKSDPTIIRDLPEKLEMKIPCTLTEEQATLYQAVVKESLERVEEAERAGESQFSRQGAVLKALLRLKQICNHPAQYLSDGSALPGRSGKLERLTEMLEEVLDVGDRALIFTQFAEMGQMLHTYLQTLFGVETLYLHGGTPVKQRDRMVQRFQRDDGPPLFILSLRAGGTGLNLTAANHVFHFDRWWNPAVEDQATDRAYRIGQTRTVQVHKLLCAGTLEERIDALIESKKDLARRVVGAGESWLGDLSTDEFREIITLQLEQ